MRVKFLPSICAWNQGGTHNEKYRAAVDIVNAAIKRPTKPIHSGTVICLHRSRVMSEFLPAKPSSSVRAYLYHTLLT